MPKSHPLRRIREMVDAALVELSPEFEGLYSRIGRPSIPPEKRLRALLLQVLFTIRSERMLMEQLDYNLLFRWFVGLGMDDAVWVATVFTKNRDRLLEGEIAQAFFQRILDQAKRHHLLSDEHFTVDGTLIEAGGLAAGRSWQSDGELPGSEAVQRHSRVADGSSSQVVPERAGPRSQARLPGSRTDGEPQRPGGQYARHHRDGSCRTRSSRRHGRRAFGCGTDHAGRRQGL